MRISLPFDGIELGAENHCETLNHVWVRIIKRSKHRTMPGGAAGFGQKRQVKSREIGKPNHGHGSAPDSLPVKERQEPRHAVAAANRHHQIGFRRIPGKRRLKVCCAHFVRPCVAAVLRECACHQRRHCAERL